MIALFYSSELLPPHLAFAAAYVGALVIANRMGIRSPVPYALVGIAGVWHCFFLSGVHPTVAGIVLASTIPAKRSRSAPTLDDDTLQRLHATLHPWVTFGVLPLFAVANAGVPLEWDASTFLGSPVALGIVTGLCLGKQIGIFTSAWLSVRLGVAVLPSGVTWRHLYGVSWLGGIGFTMSLFIASLAFYGTPSLPVAKSAVLLASLLSGVAGWLVLRWTIERPTYD